MRALLLGRSIDYSASPAMHNAAFSALGLPHRYELADLGADAVAAAVEQLRDEGFLGANVTTPHKRLVAGLMDALSPDAERIGAVNTIVRDRDRLIGHNTDLPAFAEAVRELCPGVPRTAVLIGPGGAGRAVVLALQECGVEEVVTVSRTGADHRPEELPGLLTRAGLVVNATPVGTERDDSVIPAACLRPDLAVLDLVYRPSPTRLVREARARGAPARAGAGVLLGQGWRSLELWLDAPAPIEQMRAALRTELGEAADV